MDRTVDGPLFSLCQLRLEVTFLERLLGDGNLHIDFSGLFDLNVRFHTVHFPGLKMEKIKFVPYFSTRVYFWVLVLKL